MFITPAFAQKQVSFESGCSEYHDTIQMVANQTKSEASRLKLGALRSTGSGVGIALAGLSLEGRAKGEILETIAREYKKVLDKNATWKFWVETELQFNTSALGEAAASEEVGRMLQLRELIQRKKSIIRAGGKRAELAAEELKALQDEMTFLKQAAGQWKTYIKTIQNLYANKQIRLLENLGLSYKMEREVLENALLQSDKVALEDVSSSLGKDLATRLGGTSFLMTAGRAVSVVGVAQIAMSLVHNLNQSGTYLPEKEWCDTVTTDPERLLNPDSAPRGGIITFCKAFRSPIYGSCIRDAQKSLIARREFRFQQKVKETLWGKEAARGSVDLGANDYHDPHQQAKTLEEFAMWQQHQNNRCDNASGGIMTFHTQTPDWAEPGAENKPFKP